MAGEREPGCGRNGGRVEASWDSARTRSEQQGLAQGRDQLLPGRSSSSSIRPLLPPNRLSLMPIPPPSHPHPPLPTASPSRTLPEEQLCLRALTSSTLLSLVRSLRIPSTKTSDPTTKAPDKSVSFQALRSEHADHPPLPPHVEPKLLDRQPALLPDTRPKRVHAQEKLSLWHVYVASGTQHARHQNSGSRFRVNGFLFFFFAVSRQ